MFTGLLPIGSVVLVGDSTKKSDDYWRLPKEF